MFTLYLLRRQTKTEIYYYLPQLKKYHLYDVKFKKIYATQNYKIPYDVLIFFKSDEIGVVESLELREKINIDTAELKSYTWPIEFKLYFTMKSVNSSRYESLVEEERNIEWWKINESAKKFASSFLDSGHKKNIVNYSQNKNGRIVCFKDGNSYYLLIECWG